MRSPIIKLEKCIQSVAFNIAPEREEDCEVLRDKHNLDFCFIDDKNFNIRINSSNTILLPISSLEYLWAFSVYCWILTQEYSSSQRLGLENFDCVGNDRLTNAYSLLQWAKNNILTSGVEQWPKDLPQPSSNSYSLSDCCCADDFFFKFLRLDSTP